MSFSSHVLHFVGLPQSRRDRLGSKSSDFGFGLKIVGKFWRSGPLVRQQFAQRRILALSDLLVSPRDTLLWNFTLLGFMISGSF